MNYLLLLIIVLFLAGCKEIHNEQAAAYKAGFYTVHIVDKSRLYKPDTDTTNYLHYRPLDIDVWYPADPATKDTLLLFRNILGLLEERANYYTASDAGNGLTKQLAQYFCDGFKCADTTRLLNFKTNSFRNAASVNAKFPLVLYLASYNGMSYENFSLFEDLAKKGFVVVSISSIGRYPGDMTMKKEDLQEQVNDAVACLNALKQNPNIDLNKIGIVGYSWGALAGVVLSSKMPRAACLVSLDGSEFHHYGEAKQENADFDVIINSSDFKNMHLSLPYLRLESSPVNSSGKEDSVYNFTEKLSGDKQIFKIDSAQHEDFGCMSFVVKQSGHCAGNDCFRTISKLTVSFLEDHLTNANVFATTVQQEKDKIIKKQ